MAKKSYDQRLKERWLRKQNDGKLAADVAMSEFNKTFKYSMMGIRAISSFIFRQLGR